MRTAWLAVLVATPALAHASPPSSAAPIEAHTASARNPELPVRLADGPADLAAYRTPAGEFRVHLGRAMVLRSHVVRRVHFPSARTERWGEVSGTYYEPLRRAPGEKVPAAVVVHHLAGSFEAEEILARHLAVHGVAALFVELPNYGDRREKGTRQGFIPLGPEAAFVGFQQAVLDVIRAGDVLRSRPEVDPERVGVVGVSLGALVAGTARGVDPRLGRTVLVLGGGGLAKALPQAPEAVELLEKEGVDPATLDAILAPVDPLTFAARIETGDVLMLNARRDEIVPTESTDALWEALGRPRIKWFDTGHYGTALHILMVMNDILDHFQGQPGQHRSPRRSQKATSGARSGS